MTNGTTPSARAAGRLSRRTLLGSAIAALTVLGLFVGGPAAANHPSPLNASQINSLAGSRTVVEVNLAGEIVGQINNERSARGLPAYRLDQYGANVAFSNSFHNRASGCAGDACHMTEQEWDVAYANGPPFIRAENVTSGPFYTSTGGTTRVFMNSEGHRWNILRSSADLVGIGVACTADGGMWVTHQFLVSSTARFSIDDGAAPPVSPIVTLEGAGSRCPAPPSAPTGVGATAGNASATVNWTAPANNGGSPVTGYVVTPFVGTTAGTPRSFASTATPQVITGLTNGTAYTFKVAAVNAAGTGPQSGASNSVTPRTEPATPTFTAASPAVAATVNGAYTYTFVANGHPAPTFAVKTGNLPAGLTLNPTTGVLSGTPTTTGAATFTVSAANGVLPDAVTAAITVTASLAAPAHWGPNPYVTGPSTSPYYRSIAVIDNTGDPSLSQWIQAYSNVINNLHNNYNAQYPVVLYYQNINFAPGNPCAPGPAQYIVLCKNTTLNSAAGGAPFFTALTLNSSPHAIQAVTTFKSSVVDPLCVQDKFTLVGHAFAGALGLSDNLTEQASAMYPSFTLGRCTYNGYTQADLDRLSGQYNHSVG